MKEGIEKGDGIKKTVEGVDDQSISSVVAKANEQMELALESAQKEISSVENGKSLTGINPETGQYFAREDQQKRQQEKKDIEGVEYDKYTEFYKNFSTEEIKDEYGMVLRGIESVKNEIKEKNKEYNKSFDKEINKKISELKDKYRDLEIKKKAIWDSRDNHAEILGYEPL